jgi:hypothetical protein
MSDHIIVQVNAPEGFNIPNRIDQLAADARSPHPDIAARARKELETRTTAMRDYLDLTEADEAKRAQLAAELEAASTAQGGKLTVQQREQINLRGIEPFASMEQAAVFMRDPRYGKDEKFTQAVQNRVMASNW